MVFVDLISVWKSTILNNVWKGSILGKFCLWRILGLSKWGILGLQRNSLETNPNGDLWRILGLSKWGWGAGEDEELQTGIIPQGHGRSRTRRPPASSHSHWLPPPACCPFTSFWGFCHHWKCLLPTWWWVSYNICKCQIVFYQLLWAFWILLHMSQLLTMQSCCFSQVFHHQFHVAWSSVGPKNIIGCELLLGFWKKLLQSMNDGAWGCGMYKKNNEGAPNHNSRHNNLWHHTLFLTAVMGTNPYHRSSKALL